MQKKHLKYGWILFQINRIKRSQNMEGQMKGESKNTWIDKRDDNRLIHSAESIKYH